MTLNDKIDRIAETVDQLTDVIEEKHGMEKGTLKKGCVGFEQYPTLVSNIPTNNAVTLTTVFAYAKGDNYEVHPSGGSFNPETGEIEYPEGWCDGNFIARNKSAQIPIWQTHAVFGSDGEMKQLWTPPIRITGSDGTMGPQGEQGIPGNDGLNGIDGKDGKDGKDGNNIEYIYKVTESESVIPEQPVGDSNVNESYPSDWSNVPVSITSTNTVCWISARKQYYNDENQQIWGEYSIPAVWAKYVIQEGEITDDQMSEIEESVKEAVFKDTQELIDEANEDFGNRLSAATDEFNKAKDDLQEAIKNGDEAAILAALEEVKKTYATLENLQNLTDALGTLQNTVDNIDNSFIDESEARRLAEAAVSNIVVTAEQVVGLDGLFAQLKVEDLKGTTITGKTVQSGEIDEISGDIINQGNAWKLENTGAGHIANGQISWNADGSEVQLGENVKLNWNNNIEGKPTIPTEEEIDNKIGDAIDNIEFPQGMTEDDVKQIIPTVITGDYIQTQNFLVDSAKITGNLDVSRITGLEELVTEKVSVAEITTDRLNTTPGEVKAGTIKIEGNELTVRDSNVNTEILLITGSSDVTIPTQYSLHNNFGGSSNTVFISPGTRVYSFEEYNLISESTFKRNAGAEYKLESSIPNTEFRAAIIDSKTKNIISESLDGVLAYGIVFSDATLDETWVKEHYTKMNSITISTENPSKMERISYYVVNDKSDPKNLLSIDELDSNTTYNVYVVTGYMLIGNITNNSDSLIDVYATISSPNMSIIITPAMRKTIIAGDGLYYIVSHDTYFVMNDSKFEVSIKGKKITLTENGFVE